MPIGPVALGRRGQPILFNEICNPLIHKATIWVAGARQVDRQVDLERHYVSVFTVLPAYVLCATFPEGDFASLAIRFTSAALT